MANHTGNVPSWLTVDYIQDKLANSNQFQNVTVHSMDVSPGSSVGDNYACQIFRIRLNITNDNRNENISIIGKHQPKTELTKSFEGDFDIFTVEAHMFTNTLPEIEKTTKSTLSPICYAADSKNNIILMEDLVASNFVMKDKEKRKFLNYDECVLTIEALATLHGASYHMIENNDHLQKVYEKAFWTGKKNIAMEKVFLNGKVALEKFIDGYGISSSHKTALLELGENLCVDFCKVCDFQEGKLNTLLHGDCWQNNMLFKYENGNATDVRLLDFQLSNYNCFANDLHYFIFSSASVDVIINNLEDLLEVYYKKLSSVAPTIPNLTLDRIKREFSERYYFGYILSVTFRSFTLSDEAMDIAAMFGGKLQELGYNKPEFIADLKVLLPFFEKKGII